jgi:TPR repeat protein
MEVRMVSFKPHALMYPLLAAALMFSVLAISSNPVSAAADDGSADVALGVKYLNGDGVTQDYAKALHYFQLAAALGNADGENDLGVLYDKGLGVTLDYPTALHWFTLAAAQGSADADYAIGVIYDDGHGVTQDYTKAMKYYRLAADKQIPNARNGIGILYFEGHGVPQDYTQALHWFGLAAGQHYSVAEDNVGLLYEQGSGVPQVYQIALYWDQLAVSDGDTDAAADVQRVKSLIDHYPVPQLPCDVAPTQLENQAVNEVEAHTYSAALSDFMKANFSREACIPKTSGEKQIWNIYFAAFDEFGISKATSDAFTRSYFQGHAQTIAGNLLKAKLPSDIQSAVQQLFDDTK